MLAPGIAGVTDRIRVRSIVGRFLEHSRVAYFRWGEGDDDEAVFLSSADWMGRNMFGRVEVAWPVRDRALAPARSSTNAWCPTCTTARTRGCSAATAATSGSPSGGQSAQEALMRLHKE